MTENKVVLIFALLTVIFTTAASAQTVPSTVSYQGRVMGSGGMPYNGVGYYKFAVCDQAGTVTHWSNDLTSTACSEPAASMSVTVTEGIYHVLLGAGPGPENQPLPPSVFQNSDLYLHVWFGDTSGGLEHLSPAQPFSSVPYAMKSEQASSADSLGGFSASQLDEPNVIIVDPSGGGDSPDIAGALSLAAGSTAAFLIRVAPGTYVESSLSVPSNTSLSCIKARSCYIDGSGSDVFLLGGAQSVRIEGFSITNFNYGIMLSGGETNLVIKDNYMSQGVRGISAENVSAEIGGIRVTDNEMMAFQDPAQARGIFISGSLLVNVTGFMAKDNIFQSFGSADLWGIDITGGMGVMLNNNAFLDFTTATGGSGGGVRIISSLLTNIDNSTMVSFTGGTGGSIKGMHLELAEGVNVLHSTMTHFQGDDTYGIYAITSLSAYVKYSNFTGFYTDTAVAVFFQDVAIARIQNNIIDGIGLYSTPANSTSWGIRYVYTGASMSLPTQTYTRLDQIAINNNSFFKSKNGIDVDFSASTEVGLSTKYIRDNALVGYSNVSDKGIRLTDVSRVSLKDNSVRVYNTGIEVMNPNLTNPDVYLVGNHLVGNVVDLLISPPAGGGGSIRAFNNIISGFLPVAPRNAPIIESGNLTPSGSTP